MDEIIGFVDSLDRVLTLRPVPGDDSPETSWGDVFFYYGPDGTVPTRTQPFATVVTKNYPDDAAPRVDRPDTFRVNVCAAQEDFVRWTGHGYGPRRCTPRNSRSQARASHSRWTYRLGRHCRPGT